MSTRTRLFVIEPRLHPQTEGGMEVIHERCAGIDVHKKVVVVCALVGRKRFDRSFGTTTAELRLAREWLAQLLQHGLLRASFIPDRGHRELRELVRYRRSLVHEQNREVLRIQKILEGANIKLSSVASDVMGVSGRAMLEAMAAGVEENEQLADLARGRLKAKRGELLAALDGLMSDHQRFLLKEQLRHVDELEERIGRLSEEIGRRLRPFEAQITAIDEIPGVGRRGAEEILAETGVDMGRFPTSRHISAWARVSPGNNESAGKRKSGRMGKDNPWLRSTLVEAAVCAARAKRSYLSAQFHRLAARRGKKRAAMAVAHTILVIVYHIISNGVAYRDLGNDYFDRRSKDALAGRMKRRLEALGYTVTFEEAA